MLCFKTAGARRGRQPQLQTWTLAYVSVIPQTNTTTNAIEFLSKTVPLFKISTKPANSKLFHNCSHRHIQYWWKFKKHHLLSTLLLVLFQLISIPEYLEIKPSKQWKVNLWSSLGPSHCSLTKERNTILQIWLTIILPTRWYQLQEGRNDHVVNGRCLVISRRCSYNKNVPYEVGPYVLVAHKLYTTERTCFMFSQHTHVNLNPRKPAAHKERTQCVHLSANQRHPCDNCQSAHWSSLKHEFKFINFTNSVNPILYVLFQRI